MNKNFQPAAESVGPPSDYDWQGAAGLNGLPGGGLNMAYECLDRHLVAGRGQAPALRLIDRDGHREVHTYARLTAMSQALAAVLIRLDTAPGECVASLLGRRVEFYTGLLASLRAGAVFCPLDPGFGPQPLLQRLNDARTRVLLTTAETYRRRIEPVREQLGSLRHILIVDGDAGVDADPRCLDLVELLNEHADREVGIGGSADTAALMHFTSGTTGHAKAVVHAHGAIVAQVASARIVLDLRAGDVYWCTAEPGWVTATCYGVIAPLACGATIVADDRPFDANRWVQAVREEGINVWYTTPTALRLLMRLVSPTDAIKPKSLRVIASVGEALNREAVDWAEQTFGQPVHDTWWQTETGAIMIAQRPGLPLRPGSMGQALPGIRAAIVQRGAQGRVVEVGVDEIGELALRAGWPSMFRGYHGQPERYRRCFADGWYLSGDLARRDAEGYFWFVGRKDDLIKSAGHLIGPFEVESVLMQHPAVIEAGVIGRPDELINETVKAFIALRRGQRPSDALRRDILEFARARLGALAAPRELQFCRSLPKTASGKIQRRSLKEAPPPAWGGEDTE